MTAPSPLRRALATGAVLLVAATLVGSPAGHASPATPASTAGAAPTCPAAEGNARFVRFIYLQILNRCPDAGGGAYWTRRLDGGLGRSAFALAIDTSNENLGRNNVDGMYRGLLGRAPTAAERSRWIAYLRAELENAVPIATLISSDEGYATQATGPTKADDDGAWLTWAYNRILDRAPDPQGAAYYTSWFGADGSNAAERYRVAMSLERSRSNALSWVRASLTEALGRPADPSGVPYWTTWLTGRGRWQTFRMWTLHLSSDEAYRRAQTQPF